MRLIVNFDSVGKNTVLSLNKAPANIVGINQGRNIRISALNGGDAKARGLELAKLLRRHAPVKDALTMALAQPVAAPPQPIYFRVIADAADALPWEQLYSEPLGFLALDPRCPVGRIATRIQDMNDRAFLSPFRVVAVLSAADREGTPQLQAIARALTDAKATGLDARLHVITGEQAVVDAINALQDEHVTVEWIAATPVDVARQITHSKPSIFHMLCHGDYAAPGQSGLALATMQDFLGGEKKGSVMLSLDMLARALEPCDPWLVVLAACETAAAANGAAIAHRLVDTGLPAVIGMRRLVDLVVMDRFCDALYPELLATVSDTMHPEVATAANLGPGGGPGVDGVGPGDGAGGNGQGFDDRRRIDWAPALTAPRNAVAVGFDPASVDTWSDAVLYSHQDPLRVYLPHDLGLSAEQYAHLRGQLDMRILWRERLDPATTPAAALAALDVEIADLRRQLPGERP